MRPGQRTLLLVLAALGLAVDIAVPGMATGIAAVVVMAAVVVGSARGALHIAGLKSILARRAGILKLEVALLAALVGVAAGRAYILVRELGHDCEGDEHTQAARTYTVFFFLLAVVAVAFLKQFARVARLMLRLAQRPALLLAGSFASLIAVGSTLLALPFSVRRLADISFIDSLFTVTSAVCVTGLTVNDVATTYTAFGQLVILASIQLGGIGIMTLAALVLTARSEARLAAQSRFSSMLDAHSIEDLRTLIRSIVVSTFAVEAIGMALLWAAWAGDPRLDGRPAAWMALFHSVSAFCNAGFSLFPTSLVAFQGDAFVQVVIMALIVLGGIGFPVLREVYQREGGRLRGALAGQKVVPRRYSLATRVVVFTTVLLLLGGTWLIGVLEAGRSLESLGFVDGAVNALFQSVTTRTAGFNTLDFGHMYDATLLVVIVLMFIGGSPGSCAGGVKTTTAATIFAALSGELRGREPQLGGRALPPDVIRRATAVMALSAIIVVVGTMVLSLTESQPFMKVAFEAVSAFATVGLSTGITPALSVAGKLVVVLLMFIGRVGPLTIALAIGEQGRRQPYRLAQEGLPIG